LLFDQMGTQKNKCCLLFTIWRYDDFRFWETGNLKRVITWLKSL